MLIPFARSPFLFAPDEPPAGAAPPELGTQPPPIAQPGTPPPAAPPAAPPAGEQPPQEPPAGAPEGWTPPTFEEVQAREQAIAAANRRAKALEDAAAKAQADAQAEQGQFKELYETEKTSGETLKAGLVKAGVATAVSEAAARLGFRNPALAAKLIDLGGIDGTVELVDGQANVELAPTAGSLIEARLTKALEADPYLKGQAAGGAQLPGAGGGAPAATGAAGMNAAIRASAGRG